MVLIVKNKPYNSHSLKIMNEEAVRNALLRDDFLTTSSIANLTGLSVATCGTILNELVERAEAIEGERGTSTGGRRARNFKINELYKLVMGIAIGTEAGIHSIKITIANWKGNIIHSQSLVYERMDYTTIAELVKEYINLYPNIRSIGIGVPGVVTNGKIGICDITTLENFPLKENLESQFENVIVVVENEMHFTVYGFYESQDHDKPKTVAIITFPQDNPPGARFIVDGKIMKGSTNFSGEISYLPSENTRGKEQIKKLYNPETGTDIVVKIISSIVTIINPETIAITGEICNSMSIDDLHDKCLKYVPKEHMAELVMIENIDSSFQYGLVAITLDSLRLAPLLGE